jgi:hypothetical protein
MTPLGSPQALTLEQVLGRRHKLLVDWAPSLVLNGGRELTEMVRTTKLKREEQAALMLFMEEAVEGILGREPAWFNDDDRFQLAVHSMLGIKQGVAKLPTGGKLDLRGRVSIVSLPESIGGLGALKELDLRDCTSLASLPEQTFLSPFTKESRGCTSCRYFLYSLANLYQTNLMSSLNKNILKTCATSFERPFFMAGLLNVWHGTPTSCHLCGADTSRVHPIEISKIILTQDHFCSIFFHSNQCV